MQQGDEMPDIRPINEKKYGISKYAFLMARAYSLRYNEWKEELRNEQAHLPSQRTDVEHRDTERANPTEHLGQRRAELLTKIELIEDTVMEAVGGQEAMYPYLLKYVTEEKTTYNQMVALGMPYGSTLFYEKRRKFYYLLSKKI